MLATFVAGCACPTPRSEGPNDSPATDVAIRSQAHTTFDSVVYYKPAEDLDPGELLTYAPLIVWESPAAGRLAADGRPPVLWADESTTVIHGRALRQVAYVWRIESASVAESPDAGRIGGVRLTLDEHGHPIVWEAIDAGSAASKLFVAASLERAAAEGFGPPLPGRAFSIERSRDDAGSAIVVRILDDGPVPMGPWVYLDRNGHVTTVLCRCMPSQFSRAESTVTYRIRPLRGRDDGPLSAPGVRDFLGRRRAGSSLAHLLRWPDVSRKSPNRR
ncbi:MAG: hypothetical protein L6Q92_02745 [Phycisphaerae bacterium]|nr:hypothetical protein [Phycisphaerae bacterium]